MRESKAIAKPLYVYGPFAFVLVAFIMAASSPLFLVVAIAVLYFIGLSRLMISKLSLFRDGIWFSFGPGPMAAENRRCYFSAYRVIAVELLINIASLFLHT